MTHQTGVPGDLSGAAGDASGEGSAAPGADPGRECPWCAAPAAPGATHCADCGAALAQRESIGDVRIPGLTAVDPALADFDKRPLNIPGPSPTQGLAPTLIVGALAGGPVGLAAVGGVAALAGVEFLASRHDGTDEQELADVGKPSEVLLQALEHERELGAGGAATTTPTAAAEPDAPAPDAAAADHGLSIWRDLPPTDPAPGDEPTG